MEANQTTTPIERLERQFKFSKARDRDTVAISTGDLAYLLRMMRSIRECKEEAKQPK